jgi:hypothetical protein
VSRAGSDVHEAKHISTAVLYDGAAGNRKFTQQQCLHLRTCDFCQQVLQIFVTGIVDNPPRREPNPRRHAVA